MPDIIPSSATATDLYATGPTGPAGTAGAAPAAGPGEPEAAPGGAARLSGLGVSPGRAAGPVIRMAPPPALPAPRTVTDSAVEAAAIARALDTVAAGLRRRAELAADPTTAEILDALAMMADDPMLREEAERRAHDGDDAPHALDAAFQTHRQALAALGGYLAERAADLDDLRHRAVAAALGLPMPGIPAPGHPYVLVAEDLSPADTAGLGEEVLALVTERGGPTSHTVILARGRGLPAVVACRGAMAVPDGVIVSVDGRTGEIVTGVTPEAAAEITDLDRRERARLAATRGPGRTADGHPVRLLLNVGSAADLPPDPLDGEGVGLFRTELLFLDRAKAPGFDEQVEAYTAVFARAEHVVVRTLDAGTDKPLPFLGLPPEPNPALGVRGLRVDRVLPAVLDTQLEAIAEAARRTGSRPWVMAPMVATVAEAAGFAHRARARGLTRVGVMVEIPAAALQAEELLAEVDFLSIGTNDLSQYTFAADRQHPGLADLLDPRQPALLKLIALCAEAGHALGKPVGVCGEAAGDPLLAPLLVGLGVTSLSMAPVCVPAVRDELSRHTLEECRAMLQRTW